MIYLRSKLNVADNSGARKVAFIGVIGKKNKDHADVGDIITASVKETIPNSPIKKGEVVRAVVVRTCFPIKRKDGLAVKFDKNACVIIDKQGNPRATRVFGPVVRELRDKFGKILSLAPEAI
ncbi:MAG: 50S ribosomal protein L14 [Candidatus Omnitrophica bacterium]|nr:50S ribosomal protein L14 [Candidatus Omnitrophota bacterium]MBD3268562.1 50S ribosomal protein L14 [Candidatus Omnitrophota bacterium]